MTPVKVCLILGLLALAAAADCGQGAVSSSSGACVKPVYIEGCFTYAS